MRASILTEVDLIRVASVLAPHRLEVDGADWAISREYGVQTSIVVLYTHFSKLIDNAYTYP